MNKYKRGDKVEITVTDEMRKNQKIPFLRTRVKAIIQGTTADGNGYLFFGFSGPVSEFECTEKDIVGTVEEIVKASMAAKAKRLSDIEAEKVEAKSKREKGKKGTKAIKKK